jgi:hypothetical protein
MRYVVVLHSAQGQLRRHLTMFTEKADTLRQLPVDTYCNTFIVSVLQIMYIRLMNTIVVGTFLGQL